MSEVVDTIYSDYNRKVKSEIKRVRPQIQQIVKSGKSPFSLNSLVAEKKLMDHLENLDEIN